MLRTCWKCAVGMVFGAMLLAGCGDSSQQPVEVKPPTEEGARKALETTLTAWKEGKTPDSLQQQDPPIKVSDSVWSGGQKLESYEIGKDQTVLGGAKDFAVKLTLAGKGAQQVHYIVNGQNPVAILRDIDFARELNPGNVPPPSR